MRLLPSCSTTVATLRVAFAIALAATARPAFADLEDFVSQSRYDTRYETVNGAKIRAIVQFAGPKGSYTVLDDNHDVVDVGQLANIKYFSQGAEKVLITGKWAMDGSHGFFQFEGTSDDGATVRAIHGGWNFDDVGQGGGRWSGSLAVATGIEWGNWQHDPNKDRYFCQYRYPAKGNPTAMNSQICLWYPNDPDRCGYYYFANDMNKIWGRCVCPANPAYDPNVMQWSLMRDDQWQELTPGQCPAAKNGDPVTAAIGAIQDPPI